MPLHYTESGENHSGPPLVLLHGFCETNQVWNRLRESLGKQMRVLCPDLPGFGKSPLPAGKFSIETVAGAIHSWLKDLGITSCILTGHSLGGYISLAFTENFVEMSDGICLFNSTARADTEEKKRSRNNVIAFVEKHGVDKFISSFMPLLFFDRNRERLQPEINELISIASTTPKESLIAYTRAMQKRPDRLQVLQEFSGSILFIAGDEDSAIPPEDIKLQAESLKNGKLCILKNSAHMGMYEKPEESMEAVKNFVNFIHKKRSS